MIVSKTWFLAKSPGVNGLMQVRICTMYITYTYKIKCQGKTDEGKATVEIVKNMQKTWRIFCQTRQVDWQPELTCSCGHLCSACLFLTTKEKIKLKYFITVEKKSSSTTTTTNSLWCTCLMNSFTYPGLNSTLVSTMPSEFIDVNGTCLMFCQINEQSERVVTLYNPLITWWYK